MNCKRCGQTIDSTDLFCKHCGGPISVSDAPTAPDLFEYQENMSEITITGLNKEKAKKLTTIIIPEHIDGKPVTKIGGSAFSECRNLVSVTIPDCVTTIEGGVFYKCSSLYHVVLPSSLKEISAFLFDKCVSLYRIDIPETVEKIGDYAFSHCTALSHVYIPKSVSIINASAFSYCDSLIDISLSQENENLVMEDNVIYSKDKTTIFACFQESDYFSIPESVRFIYERAF